MHPKFIITPGQTSPATDHLQVKHILFDPNYEQSYGQKTGPNSKFPPWSQPVSLLQPGFCQRQLSKLLLEDRWSLVWPAKRGKPIQCFSNTEMFGFHGSLQYVTGPYMEKLFTLHSKEITEHQQLSPTSATRYSMCCRIPCFQHICSWLARPFDQPEHQSWIPWWRRTWSVSARAMHWFRRDRGDPRRTGEWA